MLKLTKLTPALWNGAGFGNSSAVWSVKGAPEWRVFSQSGNWYAHNNATNKRIWSLTRAGLLEKLTLNQTEG